MINRDFLNKLGIKSDTLLFKKCINKQPVSREIFTFEQVDDYPNQIGMLLPEGFTCVDVDDMHSTVIIKKIIMDKGIKCIINDTVKGAHFIFRDTSGIKQVVNMPTLIGLNADTRVPGKGYIILPEGSEVDRRSYYSIPESKKLDEVPVWLVPDKDNKKVIADMQLLNLDEGDGRDNTIFKFIKNLEDYTNISYESAIEIIQIINDYVFAQPLDFSTELIPKLKEENFKSNRNKKSKQAYLVDVGKSIMVDNMIKKHKDNLYRYNGVKYEVLPDGLIHNLILREYNELFNKSDRTEIINFIRDYTIEEPEAYLSQNKYQIATPSRIIDLRTLTEYVNDGSSFNTTNINFDYKPYHFENGNKFVDDYFKTLFDSDEEIDLIYQAIGYGMLGHLPFRKSFYLIGKAETGKSFLLDRIRVIFGEDNIAAVDPLMISRDSRMAISLQDKLLNLADDIAQGQLADSSLFKKCVSGELIEIDRKHQSPIKFIPSATFIFTSNHDPSFMDKTDGIFSRLMIIRFKKKITPIRNFEDYWLPEHYEYIVYRSIQAINRALNNGNFIIPESIIAETDKLKLLDNDILLFISQQWPDGMPDKIAVSEVYELYRLWCNTQGCKPIIRKYVVKAICEHLNLTTMQTTNALDINNTGNLARFVKE